MGLNPGGSHLRKLGLIQEVLPWVLMDMEVSAMGYLQGAEPVKLLNWKEKWVEEAKPGFPE